MTVERILTNARIVTADAEIEGTLVLRGGLIAEVAEGRSGLAAALDLEGDYLLPGIVELHTDNLERQFQPRPSVRWPADAAMLAHDQQIAGAGITTVCDAICVGFYGGKQERLDFLALSLEALRRAEADGVLKADHRLHLRCEVADPHVVELFAPLVEEPHLVLVSLMDHTPGQRQWHDLDRYRTFHKGRTDASDAAFDALVERRVAEQAVYADKHRRAVLELAAGRPITLASHDDTTVEHVQTAKADGVAISEFPTTIAAAEAAREHGLATVMGAPNVILGGSHSGNVGAIDLARLDLLDALSSDYVPTSLMHAIFRLADTLERPLHEMVRLVSDNPARLIGLEDRGRIAQGRRADLVRVRRRREAPSIVTVWRQGQRVA